MFLPTLQGKQLILVEDLISKDGSLHPVQEAMVNYHGSSVWISALQGSLWHYFQCLKNILNLKMM